MAFNQASFFFYPPRYIPTVELAHNAKTIAGEPLQIVGSALGDAGAPTVLNADVLSWFQRRGFTEKESSGGWIEIFRDREETFLGIQEVIELSLPLDKAEFTELYIRFLLTMSTPDRIADWSDLVAELGHDFDLKLMNPDDNTLIPCIDFPTILKQNQNFIDLSKHFAWELDKWG
jgi:hypothetical protein